MQETILGSIYFDFIKNKFPMCINIRYCSCSTKFTILVKFQQILKLSPRLFILHLPLKTKELFSNSLNWDVIMLFLPYRSLLKYKHMKGNRGVDKRRGYAFEMLEVNSFISLYFLTFYSKTLN